jgi:hypothetical protein
MNTSTARISNLIRDSEVCSTSKISNLFHDSEVRSAALIWISSLLGTTLLAVIVVWLLGIIPADLDLSSLA